MFEVEVADVDPFRSLVKALSAVLDEGCFEADDGGIRLTAMDSSHVAMVDFELPSSFFDSYQCEGEKRITVRVGEFVKFLDRVERDEQVKISLEEDEARLAIQCRGGGHTRRFGMPVLEPLEEEVPQPQVSFKASARILTQSLRRAIRDASLVSEHVGVEASDDHLKISAAGEMGAAFSVWEKGADDLLELEAEEESSSTYSLRHLRDIVNAASTSSEVAILMLSTEMPIKMEFQLPQGRLVYYLAPLIGA
ncbi:MAG: proliferating cell nuclear antigen (pcna) [Candidatus Bathyarchaeia archaeon]